MKKSKQIAKRVFAIISFVISILAFVYIVMIAFSFLFNTSSDGGVDFLLLGIIDGGFIVLLSIIGFAFSVLSATLFYSKPMKIIASVLACIAVVSFVAGVNIWGILR